MVVVWFGWLLFWFGVLFGVWLVLLLLHVDGFVFITLLFGWFCVVFELAMFLF